MELPFPTRLELEDPDLFNLESATKYSASTSQEKNRLPALQGKRKGATGGIFGRQMLVTNQTP